MTITEFLDKLRVEAGKHKWRLRGIRMSLIRCDSVDACPMTSFSGKESDCWDEAAEYLDIDDATAEQIIMAADAEDGHDPLLREALLDAVGLS